ncbi:MAG: heparinase II/III family protein, partial [Gemmatimonadaceae bacterium]
MSVFLHSDALVARRRVAEGALAPLADSLRADLDRLLEVHDLFIPSEKAHLTKIGGRCPVHGTPLDFDPWSPRAHHCAACNLDYHDEEHYRWWIMGYQLWLAERAVHAATLYALRGDARCAALARNVLERYSEQYLNYPNADNVLGPTRPFFSTYLESIWLLQLTIALDLIEAVDGKKTLGETVRERLIVPSARLIASFDEGRSNRQVWNNAALAAAGAILGDASLVDRAVESPSGLVAHSRQALLADGTWFEGENYHLFAHRGLWCVTAIAEAQGWTPHPETARRMAEGFAAPFATALPDFTFPSRRDSQYKVSLRQWRIAESCELGLARADDPRLRSALAELYRADVAAGDTGRARSTAEAERNLGAARLSRASLGWKSLLFALDVLPALTSVNADSALLPGQGLGVLRRSDGRVYVALDYGESGGGHGHPDRLNLWLVTERARILEDVGTGAYVDPSLHWYRSTLAHNAPLIDGRSQWRVAGNLLAWDERSEAGWISATATVAPGVQVTRSVVAMRGYLVDELRWESERVVTVDLPWHVDARMEGDGEFRHATLGGGAALEDGFPYVASAENMPGVSLARLTADIGGVHARAWISADVPHEWWRCMAPGPPGEDRRRFVMLRARERAGAVRSVWTWDESVDRVEINADGIVVHRAGVCREEHRHDANGWTIRAGAGDSQTVVNLAGAPPVSSEFSPNGESVGSSGFVESESDETTDMAASIAVPRLAQIAVDLGAIVREAAETTSVPAGDSSVIRPIRFLLTRPHYRRSEDSWEAAGRPEAIVALAADEAQLVIEVGVKKRPLAFAPSRDDNPLDNEHPDINSDGVQLYLGAPTGEGRYYSWILVPEPGGDTVRVTPRSAFGAPLPLNARWRETPGGYLLRCSIARSALGDGRGADFSLDLIVNETTALRERRRGQLVLSGGDD